MIRIRVEVLATKPIVVRAEVFPKKAWDGLPRSSQGSWVFVGDSVTQWIGQYAAFVQQTADELVS